MKTHLLLLIVLAVASCTNQQNRDLKSQETAVPVQPKSDFEIKFAHADTTKAGESVACIGGIYKLINDKYVIHFTSELPVQFDSCYTIDFKDINRKLKAELLIFTNKKSNLVNICTDLISPNNPEPLRTAYTESGKVLFGYSNPTKLYGNQTQSSSIWIKELIFVDPKTGEKIKISNELLWKVLDLGTPG